METGRGHRVLLRTVGIVTRRIATVFLPLESAHRLRIQRRNIITFELGGSATTPSVIRMSDHHNDTGLSLRCFCAREIIDDVPSRDVIPASQLGGTIRGDANVCQRSGNLPLGKDSRVGNCCRGHTC